MQCIWRLRFSISPIFLRKMSNQCKLIRMNMETYLHVCIYQFDRNKARIFSLKNAEILNIINSEDFKRNSLWYIFNFNYFENIDNYWHFQRYLFYFLLTVFIRYTRKSVKYILLFHKRKKIDRNKLRHPIYQYSNLQRSKVPF